MFGHDHVLGDLFADDGVLYQLIATGGSGDRRWTINHRLWSMVNGLLSTFNKT
jgi:hypothetical protein